jgi:hypothetical protein
LTINGLDFLADPKEFSTGSLGWNISAKTVLEVNGEPQRVQIGLNLTTVGRKELPKEPQWKSTCGYAYRPGERLLVQGH